VDSERLGQGGSNKRGAREDDSKRGANEEGLRKGAIRTEKNQDLGSPREKESMELIKEYSLCLGEGTPGSGRGGDLSLVPENSVVGDLNRVEGSTLHVVDYLKRGTVLRKKKETSLERTYKKEVSLIRRWIVTCSELRVEGGI